MTPDKVPAPIFLFECSAEVEGDHQWCRNRDKTALVRLILNECSVTNTRRMQK